jgi:hypothetical protein
LTQIRDKRVLDGNASPGRPPGVGDKHAELAEELKTRLVREMAKRQAVELVVPGDPRNRGFGTP